MPVFVDQLEYCYVGSDWTRVDAPPSAADYEGVLPRRMAEHVGKSWILLTFGIKRRKYLFIDSFELDGAPMFLYETWHRNDYHRVIVRDVGSITLNVSTQPLLNGKDKVSAHTLGGNVAYEEQFGMNDECRLFEFRLKVHAAMLAKQKCTINTHMHFVMGTRVVLRGNAVLKKSRKKKERWYRHSCLRTQWLCEYGFFRRKGPCPWPRGA